MLALELSTLTRGSNFEFQRRVAVRADGQFAAPGARAHSGNQSGMEDGRVFVFTIG